MRIAIAGIRGIPARYGGFETFVERLSTRLVVRGHKVVVYNRPGYGQNLEAYHGVQIRTVPTVHNKFLETFTHSALVLAHIALERERYDVVLLCNVGNSPVAWIPRMRGIPVVLNVDGLEWKRKKWPLLAKWYLKTAEKLAGYSATQLVTDATVIEQYYAKYYHRKTTMIPYGCDDHVGDARSGDKEFLATLGLEVNRYFLYVSRLEPENNADGVLRAFAATRSQLPDVRLAIIGDAPYAAAYKRRLTELSAKDSRVVMPGGIYGDGYAVLQRNAMAYIHATEVGGTHPALVEGMGYGNCVLALDVPENVEVLGEAGHLYHSVQDLTALMLAVGTNSKLAKLWGKTAARVAHERYSWDHITQQYEDLFADVAKLSQDLIADGNPLRSVGE